MRSERVKRYQEATVKQSQQMSGSMGLDAPAEAEPWMPIRRVDERDRRRAGPDSFMARAV